MAAGEVKTNCGRDFPTGLPDGAVWECPCGCGSRMIYSSISLHEPRIAGFKVGGIGVGAENVEVVAEHSMEIRGGRIVETERVFKAR